jgi:hypothetical protein
MQIVSDNCPVNIISSLHTSDFPYQEASGMLQIIHNAKEITLISSITKNILKRT